MRKNKKIWKRWKSKKKLRKCSFVYNKLDDEFWREVYFLIDWLYVDWLYIDNKRSFEKI